MILEIPRIIFVQLCTFVFLSQEKRFFRWILLRTIRHKHNMISANGPVTQTYFIPKNICADVYAFIGERFYIFRFNLPLRRTATIITLRRLKEMPCGMKIKENGFYPNWRSLERCFRMQIWVGITAYHIFTRRLVKFSPINVFLSIYGVQQRRVVETLSLNTMYHFHPSSMCLWGRQSIPYLIYSTLAKFTLYGERRSRDKILATCFYLFHLGF